MESEAESAVYCRRHPDTETGLLCGRCGDPICPRCLVQTPVGARCRDCAQFRRPPVYQLGPRHYALAYGAALGTGAAMGVAWWFVGIDAFGLFLAVLAGAGMGWAMFRVVDWAAAGKRGPAIQAAAALGLVVAYLLRNTLDFDALLVSGDLSGLTIVSVAIVVAVTQIR